MASPQSKGRKSTGLRSGQRPGSASQMLQGTLGKIQWAGGPILSSPSVPFHFPVYCYSEYKWAGSILCVYNCVLCLLYVGSVYVLPCMLFAVCLLCVYVCRVHFACACVLCV